MESACCAGLRTWVWIPGIHVKDRFRGTWLEPQRRWQKQIDCGSFLVGQFRKRARSRLSEELCLQNESENSRGRYLASVSGAHMCMHWWVYTHKWTWIVMNWKAVKAMLYWKCVTIEKKTKLRQFKITLFVSGFFFLHKYPWDYLRFSRMSFKV